MKYLRKLEDKDALNMLEWMHDSNINCNFRFDFSKMTLDDVRNFIQNSFDEKNQHFAIVDEHNEYMGTISLKNINKVDNNAEYAIVTRTVAHGKGLALEATKEILNYAFNELKLHKVYLNVLEENGRANRFYEKCGFKYEGMSKEILYINGKYHNLNWYAIENNI